MPSLQRSSGIKTNRSQTESSSMTIAHSLTTYWTNSCILLSLQGDLCERTIVRHILWTRLERNQSSSQTHQRHEALGWQSQKSSWLRPRPWLATTLWPSAPTIITSINKMSAKLLMMLARTAHQSQSVMRVLSMVIGTIGLCRAMLRASIRSHSCRQTRWAWKRCAQTSRRAALASSTLTFTTLMRCRSMVLSAENVTKWLVYLKPLINRWKRKRTKWGSLSSMITMNTLHWSLSIGWSTLRWQGHQTLIALMVYASRMSSLPSAARKMWPPAKATTLSHLHLVVRNSATRI